MITYIIPTLWKSDCIYQTIEAVKTSRFGVEIIIIDNANSDYVSEHPSVKVVKVPTNIFVNPAWNLGVEMASNPYACLLNDDITFNIDLFNKSFYDQVINSEAKKDIGIIAFKSGGGFSDQINSNHDSLTLHDIPAMGTGFGQIMLFEKKYYEPIPEGLKIYFGDNVLYFLFENILGKKSMYFKGLQVVGELSATSKSYEDQIQKELPYFEQFVKTLYNKYKSK